MSKTGKIVTVVLWALLIVSAVLIISLMVNISENDLDPTMGSWVNTNLVWAYILTALGAGIAILAGLVKMTTDKKAAKNGIISLVFMGVVVLISYLLASPEIPQFAGVEKFLNDGTLNETVAKWVDTGLYTTYILLAIAVLSIAGMSVTRLFK
ncbi:hypothetical protein [uncultured Draconibacterium sp.]|uniref:hypothetical protein n=1 Tax=uncultured Draconibacterium sp. TaxID=1573823 RepID=UPI0032176FDE